MQTLDIRLRLPDNLVPEEVETAEYDDELDDVRSILRDVCSSLQQVGGVVFNVIAGSPIPVSVRRDLCIVMEQLADVLDGLHSRVETSLDFYGQGIEERLVVITQSDREVLVERRPLVGPSRIDAIPLCIKRGVLLDMLAELATGFLTCARARCPIRTQHPWFTSWAAQLEDQLIRLKNEGRESP
jgi:hypothetical protein